MRIRAVCTAGAAVAAVAAIGAAAAFAPTASASRSPITPTAAIGTSASSTAFSPMKMGTCIDQSDNDNGIGVVSQDFEDEFDAYDSRGADDFKLRKTCQIKMVMVEGAYFNGSGLATSENVTFYRDMAGVPGGVISNQKGLLGEDDGAGNFMIMLSSPVGLRAGKYWVSVQVNMDFSQGGEWSWNTNNTQRGNPAVWRNKDDGFGTGCVHYTLLTQCVGAGEGPDFSFMLHGSGPGSH